MTDHPNNPEIVAAELWAQEHRDLLTRCFERFKEVGEWPSIEDLQLDFARAGQDVDIAALAYSMPGMLGFVEQQRLVLLLRALAPLPGAAPILTTWFAVARIAYDRWISEGAGARITRVDVERASAGDEMLAYLTSVVLLREGWPIGGGGSGTAKDDWVREITSQIRVVGSATNAGDVIAARDAQLYPVPAPVQSAGSGAAPSRLRGAGRAWGSLSRHPLWSAVIAGLILLGVGTLAHFLTSEGGGQPSSTSASGRRTVIQEGNPESTVREIGEFEEQAGEGGAFTYRNPHKLSEAGKRVGAGQHVVVGCRTYAPEPESVVPDGYWYRLMSSPWNGEYFAPANSFWNGDVPGVKPYTHNTDFNVPKCGSGQ